MQPMRYSQFRRLLPELSDKVLSERLHELEESGLVTREVERDGPSVTVYRLSSRGESLRPVLASVYKWGLEHASVYGARWAIPHAVSANPLRWKEK
jgi:DNA-binding HxlR family transcriptional regulator